MATRKFKSQAAWELLSKGDGVSQYGWRAFVIKIRMDQILQYRIGVPLGRGRVVAPPLVWWTICVRMEFAIATQSPAFARRVWVGHYLGGRSSVISGRRRGRGGNIRSVINAEE